MYNLTIDCSLAADPPAVMGMLTCGADVSGNTTSASNSVGMVEPDNWWMLTVSEQALYTFDSCGSSFDTCVALYVLAIVYVYVCA